MTWLEHRRDAAMASIGAIETFDIADATSDQWSRWDGVRLETIFHGEN